MGKTLSQKIEKLQYDQKDTKKYFGSISKKTATYLVKPSDSVSRVSYDGKCGEKENYLPKKRARIPHDMLKTEYLD